MDAKDFMAQLKAKQTGGTTPQPQTGNIPQATKKAGFLSNIDNLIKDVKENPSVGFEENKPGIYKGKIESCELTESKAGLAMLKYTINFTEYAGLPKTGKAWKYSMLESENKDSKAPKITLGQTLNMLAILGVTINDGEGVEVFENLTEFFKDKEIMFEITENGFTNFKEFMGKRV